MYYWRRKNEGKGEEEGYKEGKRWYLVAKRKENINYNGKGNDRKGKDRKGKDRKGREKQESEEEGQGRKEGEEEWNG